MNALMNISIKGIFQKMISSRDCGGEHMDYVLSECNFSHVNTSQTLFTPWRC